MVTVRALGQEELPMLVAAFPEQGAAPTNRHEDRFDRQQRGQITYLVAWLDEEPVGYVFLRWPGADDLTEQGQSLGCVELADLFVAPSARGRGVGEALLQTAESLAARGHARLGLEVTATNPFNDAARRLYRRRSYHEAGLDPFISGYTYWDRSGRPLRDAELYVYLVKEL
jgi:GNAT superfamily N-acetyltransferase